jgi:hypothetical protein
MVTSSLRLRVPLMVAAMGFAIGVFATDPPPGEMFSYEKISPAFLLKRFDSAANGGAGAMKYKLGIKFTQHTFERTTGHGILWGGAQAGSYVRAVHKRSSSANFSFDWISEHVSPLFGHTGTIPTQYVIDTNYPRFFNRGFKIVSSNPEIWIPGIATSDSNTSTWAVEWVREYGTLAVPSTQSSDPRYTMNQGDILMDVQPGDVIYVWARSTHLGNSWYDHATTGSPSTIITVSVDIVGRYTELLQCTVTESGVKIASIDSRKVFGQPNFDGEVAFDPNSPPSNPNFLVANMDYRGGLFAGHAPNDQPEKPRDMSGKAMVMVESAGMVGDALQTLSLFQTGSSTRFMPESTSSVDLVSLSRVDIPSNGNPLLDSRWTWQELPTAPVDKRPGWLCESDGNLPTNSVSVGSTWTLKSRNFSQTPLESNFVLEPSSGLHFLRPTQFYAGNSPVPSWVYFANSGYETKLQEKLSSYQVKGFAPKLLRLADANWAKVPWSPTSGLGNSAAGAFGLVVPGIHPTGFLHVYSSSVTP